MDNNILQYVNNNLDVIQNNLAIGKLGSGEINGCRCIFIHEDEYNYIQYIIDKLQVNIFDELDGNNNE